MKTFALSLCIFLGLFSIVSAQSFGVPDGSITLTSTPQFPEPGDTVTVFVRGNIVDVSRADITWRENGVITSRGIGDTSYSFTAGSLGSTHTVSVAVIAGQGGVDSETVTIRPSIVDLIWEADSQTPPFYEGKALRAPQSSARVQAFPHVVNEFGVRINPDTLVYTWKFNDKVMGAFSGYGESLFVSDVSPRENTIDVEVSTTNGTLLGRERITIPNTEPFFEVYRMTPLRGIIFESALKASVKTKADEYSLYAFPYFLATEGEGIEYSWELNGDSLDRNSLKHIVTLGKSEERGGAAKLSIEANHLSKAFQRVREQFSVIFE